MYQTNQYEGMLAETVAVTGHKGDVIYAYYARPLGPGPYPGMVIIHHAPGWDEWYRECARRFAHHGYATVSPNLYFRDGHGTAEDVGAKVRAAGGVPDEQVLGDLDGSLTFLRAQPHVSSKVGVFGTCSGGRHGFLAACRLKGFSALVECWGGNVVQKPEELTPKRPVAPIDYTKDLSCPMIGIFGNDDKSPSP
ncbi:MAG TPA: dienelactone hydrolase family protein, partial [Candidatus Limnocylindria bacterium]|nr:dienelactone hydrolase family protein [Candidatus Limnocylindria bacterium]